MTVLVISDLHLSPERPALTRAFCRFLQEKAHHAEALYILGDLVEAWVGDDDPSEFARDVKRSLHLLVDGGTRLYFLHGNRDFLVGPHFAHQVGAQLLPQEHIANIHGQRILMLHGDTLCTEDHAYQRFRRLIRNPLVLWGLRHLPLRRRQRIASNLRERSRAANSNKPEAIMDVSPEAVEEALRRHGVSIMVHGHTHRPGIHRLGEGPSCRIVLGDWDREGWYLQFSADESEPQLIRFPIQTF